MTGSFSGKNPWRSPVLSRVNFQAPALVLSDGGVRQTITIWSDRSRLPEHESSGPLCLVFCRGRGRCGRCRLGGDPPLWGACPLGGPGLKLSNNRPELRGHAIYPTMCDVPSSQSPSGFGAVGRRDDRRTARIPRTERTSRLRGGGRVDPGGSFVKSRWTSEARGAARTRLPAESYALNH